MIFDDTFEHEAWNRTGAVRAVLFVDIMRPMRFPVFYDMFRDGIKNTWTVEEVDFQTDLVDLKQRITPAEVHVIQRLVAFFATGDSIVSNNLVLNLYKHINSPEARLYLSRQLFEEAVHVVLGQILEHGCARVAHECGSLKQAKHHDWHERLLDLSAQ